MPQTSTILTVFVQQLRDKQVDDILPIGNRTQDYYVEFTCYESEDQKINFPMRLFWYLSMHYCVAWFIAYKMRNITDFSEIASGNDKESVLTCLMLPFHIID